jgi:hypothetical protein
MYGDKSRYKGLESYTVPDRKGRDVAVMPVPEAPTQTLLGFHLRKERQRLDHLAAKYLDDPAGFWRIAELADVMFVEALTEAPEIPIPRRSR